MWRKVLILIMFIFLIGALIIMAVKHEDVKTTGQRGYASEWNKDHVIDDGTITETKIGTNAVTTAKIKDGNITTAKINIDADLGFNSKKITGLGTPTEATNATTKAYVDRGLKSSSVYNGFIQTTSSTYQDVVSLTHNSVTGKVLVLFSSHGGAYGADSVLRVKLLKDGADVAGTLRILLSQGGTIEAPINIMNYDASAGNNTWKIQYQDQLGGHTVELGTWQLIVLDLL